MSIRCSLLGHSYGEVEIERDREEQGSEVVVTVREFEECERCGKQNVVSENKEVTALQSPAPDLESAESDPDVGTGADAGTGANAGTGADAGASADAGGASSASSSGDATGVPDEEVPAGEDDAEILTDSPDDGGPGQSSDSPSASAAGSGAAADSSPSANSNASASAGASTDSGASANAGASADAGTGAGSAADDEFDAQLAADDDGMILDDDASSDDGERQPGEWPAAETTHPSDADEGEQTPWPEVGREDEGFDAEPGGGSADVEFGGGLTPESAPEVDEDEADEVEFVNAEGDALRAPEAESSEPELSSGISAGAEAPTLSGPADDVAVDAEFVCPECDYRKSVAGSSLRAGDICPECSRGYLAQE